MAEPLTYSHHDIQRYLQHKMPPQEMHDFEKALMNDPFLADAIEGFSAGDPAVSATHLELIENELTNTKEEARIVPLISKRTTWWKVAAIVLVVVFAGILTYSVVTDRSTKESSMAATNSEASPFANGNDTVSAANEQPLASVKPPSPANVFEDRSAPVIQPGKQPSIAYQPPPVQAYEQLDTATTYEVQEEAALMAASARMSKATTNEAASAKMLRQQSAAAQQGQNEFEGTVIDETGEAIPFASIRADNGRTSTVADAKGNFSLKAEDSVVKVNVQSPGYSAATAEIMSNRPANIKLALQQQTLSDEVVIGMGTKKKRTIIAHQAGGSSVAEPVGGWKNFQQYLDGVASSTSTSKDDGEAAEDIVLEFSIDNRGRPADIKALEKSNKKKSQKAIKILHEGPNWTTPEKDKKVKVIITL